MNEMLLVGRGGQGVVLASQILADTFARAGFWVQSFPEFKAERRGAPISAFLRWDESRPSTAATRCASATCSSSSRRRLRRRSLLRTVRPGGLVVLNRETRFPSPAPFDIARVPASRIAREHGILSSEGRPMGNVAVLGACVKLLAPEALEFLEQAIAARMGARADANIAAAREGYARCTRQHALAGDTPYRARAGAPAARARPSSPSARPTRCATTPAPGRSSGPLLRDACTACALCALFCPEGAITRTDGTMVDRLPLLQGLRHLRGRLPGPQRDRDGGGAA